MVVELLGLTYLTTDDFFDTGFELDPEAIPVREEYYDPDHLAEFAGRGCYQSYHKPNAKTRSNKAYLANILNQQHESVLEHSSVSFFVRGVSRALLTELSRHRHLSFSVESQRFVEPGDEVVVPPLLQDHPALAELVEEHHLTSLFRYGEIYSTLKEKGVPKKQAREAARSVLPNATPVTMVVSGNLRAWRDVLKKRLSPAADAEIRLFAEAVLKHLKEVAPNSVQDIEVDNV